MTHVISTLAWMVLPHHQSEWRKYLAEAELLHQVGKESIPAGQYIFPQAANAQEMSSEEDRSKLSRCRGTLVLWDQPASIGAAVGQTLAFFFVAAFLEVFRFTSTTEPLTHCDWVVLRLVVTRR